MPVAPASGFAGPATGPDSAALPGDWQKLGFDSDPLPGDPRVLQQIVEDFTVPPDVHDILNLLSPDGPTTATRPEPRHLPWQGPEHAAAPTPPSSHAQELGSVPPPVAGDIPAYHELLAPYPGKFLVRWHPGDPEHQLVVVSEAGGDGEAASMLFAAQLRKEDGLVEVWHVWAKDEGRADRLLIDPRTNRLVTHIVDARDDYAHHPLNNGEWHIDYQQGKATHTANAKETGLTATVQLQKDTFRLVDSSCGHEKEYVKQRLTQAALETIQELAAGQGEVVASVGS
ncbi:MAG: hypothetical protein JO362_01230 [Streptomycetaceae bacterium]|nr:hypothetical protein [Streptomycetaceae bacterium]